MDEPPAVTLWVERLVAAMASRVLARLLRDACPRRQRTLVMREDVGDGHAQVLALDAAALRADRAVGALRTDSDHAVAELDERVVDHTVRALQPRRRDLAEPERALQERERGADVRIRK